MPEAPNAPDLVRRVFARAAPSQLWVADEYVPTAAGFLYLAAVLDVFSRRIADWAMRGTLHPTVVLDVRDMAATKGRRHEVMHDSGQGELNAPPRRAREGQSPDASICRRRCDDHLKPPGQLH